MPFDAEKEKRKKLLEEIKNISHKYAHRLSKRVHALIEDAEEEYPNTELLSANSLEGFLKFIKLREKFKYPDLTLTPNGNLRAQWQEKRNVHLAIEFISATEVKLVIFAPEPRQPVKVAIASVISSIDIVEYSSWSTNSRQGI